MMTGPGIIPKPHWWKASACITMLSLHKFPLDVQEANYRLESFWKSTLQMAKIYLQLLYM